MSPSGKSHGENKIAGLRHTIHIVESMTAGAVRIEFTTARDYLLQVVLFLFLLEMNA